MSSGHLGAPCLSHFFPLASRSKSIQVGQAGAMNRCVADLDDAAEPRQSCFVKLVVREEFRVIAEVPQKPAQLPQSFRSAVEPAGDRSSTELARLEDRKTQCIKRLLRVPAVLDTFHSNQEHTIGTSFSADCAASRR